ncbi:MAG: tRNA lysidine(34) synthetase TilS [Neomegalonema sp.]|nr:tRNA lysidine(34) synthetase TilS [Neomegalonema sp.]
MSVTGGKNAPTSGKDAPAAPISAETFAALIAAFSLPPKIAIAVSGGGDSMALLRLMHRWAAGKPHRLLALTVDHGLRPESSEEARQVGTWCAALGIEHRILHWKGDKPSANLQARAREARLTLLREACESADAGRLMLAHTLEDQAETFLLNLARGSGVDGLSAMAPVSREGLRDGLILRPLLSQRRSDLRASLRAIGQDWFEDPSNRDPRFDRVRLREAMPMLEKLGLSPSRLAATARNMSRAREALDSAAVTLGKRACLWSPMRVITLDPVPLRDAPEEIVLRVLRQVLCEIAGAAHPPSLEPLLRLRDWVAAPATNGLALHGCLIRRRADGRLAVLREAASCEGSVALRTSKSWDGFYALPPLAARFLGDCTIRALREDGYQQIVKFEDLDPPEPWTTAPHEARLAALSVWRGGKVLAVPQARKGDLVALLPPKTLLGAALRPNID